MDNTLDINKHGIHNKDTIKIDVNATSKRMHYTISFETFDYDNQINSEKQCLLMSINHSDVDKLHAFIAKQMQITNSYKVKQFTEESRNIKCPVRPEKMDKKEVEFIIKMVLSEMTELAQTVSSSPEEAIDLVKNCIGTDINMNYVKPANDIDIIVEQYDAFVDANYYMLNTAAKKGVNLDDIFNEVHKANMSKKHADGKFHTREDGKVIKPNNWQEANIRDVILRHKSW